MTAKTTVTISAVNAAGGPDQFRYIDVRLVHGGAGGTVDGLAITDADRVRLDEDGEGSIDLYPNDAISPAGTYYTLTAKGVTPAVVRLIEVPVSGPVDWADAAIQLEDPSPPVAVPAPSSGQAFQVLRVDAEGTRYELADPTGGSAAIGVGGFVADTDMSGGDFDTIDIIGIGPIPRVYSVGLTAVLTEGDDVAHIWTITESGPCTQGPAIVPYQVYTTSIGQIGVPIALDTVTVSGVAVQAKQSDVEAEIAALEAEIAALEVASVRARVAAAFNAPTPTLGDRLFLLCGDADGGGSEYTRNAWSTPAFNWTASSWIRANGVHILGTGLPASPTDGQGLFGEIATRPHTAIGSGDFGDWDDQELAPWRIWVAAEHRWKVVVFYEKTSTSAVGTVDDEDLALDSRPIEIPLGIGFDFALYDEFDTGSGLHRVRLLIGCPDYLADVFLDGRGWITVATHTGPALDIVDSVLRQYIGLDLGHLHAYEVLFAEAPGDTLIASPNADDAFAAGDGMAFEDSCGRTWTPDGDGTTVPTP